MDAQGFGSFPPPPDPFDSAFDDRRMRPAWIGPFLLGVTLAVATVLYAMTRQPLIAVFIPWLHGAWELFHTAFWLLKSDAVRSRARICFAFYLAAGCWRAAAMALLSVGVFVYVAVKTGAQPRMDEFAATMIALVIGLMLNMILGLGAICAAVVHKVRVWVNPGFRRAVHGDLRIAASHERSPFEHNHAVVVVATAFVFPLAVGGAILIAVFPVDRDAGTMSLLIGILTIFGGPLAAIPCYAWLSSRIIARSPQECWQADTFTEDDAGWPVPTR